MKDKWILILGANSDIARETARSYAREGWNLYLASRDQKKLATEATHLRVAFDVEVSPLHFDALNYESHAAFYMGLEPKPFGIILAFGYLGDQITAQTDFSQTRRIIESNYLGAVSILEVASQEFEERRFGFIVGISSVAGDRGRASNYLYGSAKAGFSAYLSGLRHRLFKSDVHVMTVKPGFVETKMTAGMNLPQRLLAEPEDVATAILKGVSARKNTVYVKSIWYLIMLIIKHIPEPIFKKMNM